MTALTIIEKGPIYDRIKISNASHIQNLPARTNVSVLLDNQEWFRMWHLYSPVDARLKELPSIRNFLQFQKFIN
jgi:hypothetical protein